MDNRRLFCSFLESLPSNDKDEYFPTTHSNSSFSSLNCKLRSVFGRTIRQEQSHGHSSFVSLTDERQRKMKKRFLCRDERSRVMKRVQTVRGRSAATTTTTRAPPAYSLRPSRGLKDRLVSATCHHWFLDFLRWTVESKKKRKLYDIYFPSC